MIHPVGLWRVTAVPFPDVAFFQDLDKILTTAPSYRPRWSEPHLFNQDYLSTVPLHSRSDGNVGLHNVWFAHKKNEHFSLNESGKRLTQTKTLMFITLMT